MTQPLPPPIQQQLTPDQRVVLQAAQRSLKELINEKHPGK